MSHFFFNSMHRLLSRSFSKTILSSCLQLCASSFSSPTFKTVSISFSNFFNSASSSFLVQILKLYILSFFFNSLLLHFLLQLLKLYQPPSSISSLLCIVYFLLELLKLYCLSSSTLCFFIFFSNF